MGTRKFSDVEAVYAAIVDIDRIIENNPADKLEAVWHAIQDVEKEQFDSKNVDEIVKGIRDSLVKIYMGEIEDLSRNIGIEFTDKITGIQKATVTNIQTKIS